MAFACARIVHGIDLTPHFDGPLAVLEEFLHELASDGLLDSASNGLGEHPIWLGTELGFIEAASNSLKGCRMEPTDADRAGYEARRKALLDHLGRSKKRNHVTLAKFVREAVPVTFLAWASS